MAVDIVRYVDSGTEQIYTEVVSSIVPQPGQAVEIPATAGTALQVSEVSYRIAHRLDDFLDRDDKVHIAVIELEPLDPESSSNTTTQESM